MSIQTTDDEMAFIRTIIESPDDDAPRLIFADWLDENGQPDTAAIIRMQVKYKDPVSGVYGLCTRMCDDRGDDRLRSSLDWRLGFVSSITCILPFFHDHFNEMKNLHPIKEVMIIPSADRREWYPLNPDEMESILEKCEGLAGIRVNCTGSHYEITPEHIGALRTLSAHNPAQPIADPLSGTTEWVPIDPAHNDIDRGAMIYRYPDVYRYPDGRIRTVPELVIYPVGNDLAQSMDRGSSYYRANAGLLSDVPVTFSDDELRSMLGIPPHESEGDTDGEV